MNKIISEWKRNIEIHNIDILIRTWTTIAKNPLKVK